MPTKITYQVEVERCDKCPAVTTKRTIGAGFALDFICSLTGKCAHGYVEYESEWKNFEIPLWCPFRPKENKPLYDVGL